MFYWKLIRVYIITISTNMTINMHCFGKKRTTLSILHPQLLLIFNSPGGVFGAEDPIFFTGTLRSNLLSRAPSAAMANEDEARATVELQPLVLVGWLVG